MNNVVKFGGAGDPPPEDAATGAEGRSGGKKPKEPDWDKYRDLLSRFALIYGTDTVYDDGKGIIMKIAAMAHAHGSDYVRMWKSAPNSGLREEGKRWTVDQCDVVFDPTEKCDPLRCINLFRGLTLEPVEGDVLPMRRLIWHLLERGSETEKDQRILEHWLLSWLAYPLQHPGAKMRCAVVMHGDEGAGKNFLGETMLQIYGEYGKLIGQDELEDKFNDWRSRTMFVVADEASTRQELVHNKNRLKALITSPTVQINPKNLPRREETNHMNVVFFSNEITPLALDNSDRRYLVIFTPPAKETEFYRALSAWRDDGGAAKWFDFLLNWPLHNFDPFAPPPMTSAKQDLIELNRKTPERFWMEWSTGEIDLPYAACSIDQAYRAYSRFAQRSGDRYPLMKPVFSRMVTRVSDSNKRPMRVKTFKIDDGAVKRSTRMLLTAEPNLAAFATEGAWALDAVAAFEPPLRRYLHGSLSLEGEGENP